MDGWLDGWTDYFNFTSFSPQHLQIWPLCPSSHTFLQNSTFQFESRTWSCVQSTWLWVELVSGWPIVVLALFSFLLFLPSQWTLCAHTSAPSETFPHWPAAPVRWLFLEGRMFKLAADSDSCFFAGDAEEEPVPVTGYTHTHIPSSTNSSTSRMLHPFMGFILPPA